ncbi:Uncharacterised protein [Mycobacteroides abscessus subsp. abscessus]|nr:Uncharacterised protein [Mycobacteroides abscessus subsp. abscessus]
MNAGPGRGQLGDGSGDLLGDFGGIGLARAQDQLCLGREPVRRGHQVRQPLLPGDPPDERHNRTGQVHAEPGKHRSGLGERLLRIHRVPRGGVDPIAHHMNPVGVEAGIGRDDVIAHPAADRDDGISGVYGGVFHPRRHPVSAAELFGLPWAAWLQGMCGHDVRDAVQQLGQMTGHSRVPGMRMHHGRAGGRGGHHQIGGQGGQGGVGAVQRGVGPMRERVVAGRAHTVHVDIAQCAQLRNQLGDMDTRPAVHLGWILPRHHGHPRHSHDRSRWLRRPLPLALHASGSSPARHRV